MPAWGDIGATYDPTDGRVYVYGHGPAGPDFGGDVHLCRASAAQATDVSAYEYWDHAFWNNHRNTWMLLAGADVGYTDITVMTAPALEGPWTAAVTIASTCPGNACGAIRYCVAPHPEYDPGGATTLVTWTDSNVIWTARIHWQ